VSVYLDAIFNLRQGQGIYGKRKESKNATGKKVTVLPRKKSHRKKSNGKKETLEIDS